MFCLRVMVGVIILYDHVHPIGAFAKSSPIDVSTTLNELSKSFDERLHHGQPRKNAPSPGRPRLPPNAWFLRPIRVHAPNNILISSAVLAQLMVMFNRQTHRPRIIDNSRLHLCTLCMQCDVKSLSLLQNSVIYVKTLKTVIM